MVFARIDAVAHEDIADAMDVEAFPAFRLFKRGVLMESRPPKPPDRASLAAWVRAEAPQFSLDL